jgi:hypothetical protein
VWLCWGGSDREQPAVDGQAADAEQFGHLSGAVHAQVGQLDQVAGLVDCRLTAEGQSRRSRGRS